MNTIISNEFLVARIKHKGAELSSLFSLEKDLEYIWNADPAYWAKSSPVLFPVVGALKDNTYVYNGKSYNLPRHGFAREINFELEKHFTSQAVFILRSNESTRESYPFSFTLRISYELAGRRLTTTYEVVNGGEHELLFSLGAHPAFRVPLKAGEEYHDYLLEFDRKETSGRWPVMEGGLIGKDPEPSLDNTSILPLSKDLFSRDALVFKNLSSKAITLRNESGTHGLKFSFEGFPFFGIWAAPGADFVCLEPWCGIADSVGHNQDLYTKEGINRLESGGVWTRSWSTEAV